MRIGWRIAVRGYFDAFWVYGLRWLVPLRALGVDVDVEVFAVLFCFLLVWSGCVRRRRGTIPDSFPSLRHFGRRRSLRSCQLRRLRR